LLELLKLEQVAAGAQSLDILEAELVELEVEELEQDQQTSLQETVQLTQAEVVAVDIMDLMTFQEQADLEL
jgi:hypothetical protein